MHIIKNLIQFKDTLYKFLIYVFGKLDIETKI